jgi:hypothetical protein
MEWNEIVNGVPLIFVVMGLVELTKAFGASGKLLTGLSMAIGLILGVLYQISLGIPVDFAGWFGAVLYGLALGITASGVYNAIRNAANPYDNGVG